MLSTINSHWINSITIILSLIPRSLAHNICIDRQSAVSDSPASLFFEAQRSCRRFYKPSTISPESPAF